MLLRPSFNKGVESKLERDIKKKMKRKMITDSELDWPKTKSSIRT